MKKYQTYMKAYEDKDCIGDEDASMYVFHVDINDKDSIKATLKSLLTKLRNEKFISEVQEKSHFPYFAVVENKVAEEIYFSSDEVYAKAVQYEHLRPIIQEICEEIRCLHEKNGGNPLWENDENILGVVPAFALAVEDKEHIWTATYILMAAPNGDHSMPYKKVETMMKKWGTCLETLMFFGATCANMPDIPYMMRLGFDDYLKNKDNLNMFFRPWYAHTFGNYFFQLALKSEPHKRKFIDVFIKPIVREILKIDENVETISENIFKMVESEIIPDIDSIVEQQ